MGLTGGHNEDAVGPSPSSPAQPIFERESMLDRLFADAQNKKTKEEEEQQQQVEVEVEEDSCSGSDNGFWL